MADHYAAAAAVAGPSSGKTKFDEEMDRRRFVSLNWFGDDFIWTLLAGWEFE